jgi:thiamine biosynthesis lipoprotein
MKNIQGTRYVMGTFLTVHVQGADEESSRQAHDCIFSEVQHLDELLSIHRPTSEISRINRAAGTAGVSVSSQTYAVVEKSLYYAEISGGAFDPVVPCGDLSANYRHVYLDPITRTVFLATSGMHLDLGGIGKGFALDCALEKARMIPSLIKIVIDFGGQLLFWTPQGTFDPVRIAIENPENRNAILSTLQIGSNGSLSTSSNAEHPGHLLDPRTGQPAQGMSSVTVMAPTGTEAEALSTALFVLKPQEASALLEKCPAARAYIFEKAPSGPVHSNSSGWRR